MEDIENKFSGALDLQTPILVMYAAIMLAQAQACFFQKAADLNQSPGLVSKLAIGASDLYHKAVAACRAGASSLVFKKTKLYYPFDQHCRVQQLLFQGLANQWQAKAELEAREYGREIAYLKQAERSLQEAKSLSAGLVTSLADLGQSLLNEVQTRITVADKDNEVIYFFPVPSPAALPTIPPKVVCVPTDFQRPTMGPTDQKAFAEAFNKLIPKPVKEAIELFNVRRSELINTLSKKVQQEADDVKATLASLNLPAAIDSLSASKGLPDGTWGRIQAVQLKGGFDALQQGLVRVQTAARDSNQQRLEVLKCLEEEATDDEEMRKKWGAGWNRSPSAELTVAFHADLAVIQSYLDSGRSSDQKVATELAAMEEQIKGLGRGKDEIESTIPTVSGGTDKPETAALTAILDKISVLLQKKISIVKILEQKAATLDEKATTTLLATCPKPGQPSSLPSAAFPEQVITDILAVLDPVKASLTQAQKDQQDLLSTLDSANAAFVKAVHRTPEEKQREKALQEVHSAVDLAERLFTSLAEGTNFYSQLVCLKLQPLQQKTADFSMARQEEKLTLLNQIVRKASERQAVAPTAPGGDDQPPSNAYFMNPNLMQGAGSGLYASFSSPSSSSSASSSPSSSVSSSSSSSAFSPFFSTCTPLVLLPPRMEPVVTEVFTLLRERQARRPFCSPKLWLLERLPLRRLEDEMVQGRPAQWFLKLLQRVPFVLPFDFRVRVFSFFIEQDKSEERDAGLAFARGHGARVSIRRDWVLEDGFDKLNPIGSKLKGRVQVTFIDKNGVQEDGVDGGGLFKEFLTSMITQAFNPNYGLWSETHAHYVYPNPDSGSIPGLDHLQLFRFIGRVLGKALYDGVTIEPEFALFFLRILKGQQNMVDDLRSLDPEYYRSLILVKNYPGDVKELELTFSVNRRALGELTCVDLIPDGSATIVTNENRMRYLHLLARYKTTNQIKAQADAFVRGLRDIINRKWLDIFTADELSLLISGVKTMDLNDLKKHMQYSGGYTPQHEVIRWFWEVVQEFDEKQKSAFLRFVTSCSRAPLLGFGSLSPLFCIQHAGNDQDSLPTAATCMNLLRVPRYVSKERLRQKLLYAISAGAGFGLS
eukprot:gb/GEZN01000545.1/.p1 GENE.gb/GEZN01000545.1/~~gb/GEZN01000545.1/.p1  ORF type:complete len:1289 (-),score=222.03 gb/GEZN01000545.1/:324-3647(-)